PARRRVAGQGFARDSNGTCYREARLTLAVGGQRLVITLLPARLQVFAVVEAFAPRVKVGTVVAVSWRRSRCWCRTCRSCCGRRWASKERAGSIDASNTGRQSSDSHIAVCHRHVAGRVARRRGVTRKAQVAV